MGQDPPSDPDISTRQTLRLPVIDLKTCAQISAKGDLIISGLVSEAIDSLGEAVRADATSKECAPCKRINPG